LGGGMRGHIEMDDATALVSQNQEHVQDLKPDRQYRKEVDRHHSPDVILQEGPPALRRRLPLAYDVIAHAGFADVDAEFEQFAMDAGRAPERILAAHFADQFSHVFRDRWSAQLAATDFPCPEQPE